MSAQGMAVQALAGEIAAAVKADSARIEVYDVGAGHFGPAFTELLNRLAGDALHIYTLAAGYRTALTLIADMSEYQASDGGAQACARRILDVLRGEEL